MGVHGQGTRVPIETRRKDGTVRRRIRVAVTMPGGKRVWRTVRSDREADRIQADLVEARELDLDPTLRTRQTLEGYLRSWIDTRRESRRRRIRDRTLEGYRRIVEQRIIPKLGKLRLGQVTKRRIQEWVDEQPGSPRTVGNAHAVLRAALADLVGDVLPSNPAIGVELPDKDRYAAQRLSVDEVRRLLTATEGTRLHAYWRLAILTGLREAELLGLGRDKLDGDVLSVTEQLQRYEGQWRLEPLKPGRRIDRLALDPETVRILRAHLAAMAAERTPRWRYFGLMFVTEQGEPYHASRVLTEFHRACDAAGVPRRRVHDLRHTANSLLKDAGIPAEVRKARLGHSSDEMTAHYGGASEVLDRAAVAAVAEAIA